MRWREDQSCLKLIPKRLTYRSGWSMRIWRRLGTPLSPAVYHLVHPSSKGFPMSLGLKGCAKQALTHWAQRGGELDRRASQVRSKPAYADFTQNGRK